MEPVIPKQPSLDLSRLTCDARGTHSRDCPMNMERGLHARPCAMLMKLASHFAHTLDGESVTFTVGRHTVDPTRGILGMLGLVGGKGSVLTVTVRGAAETRAQGLLDAVEAIVRHPCPEDVVCEPDAARTLGISPEVIDVLLGSVQGLKPD